MLTDRPSCIILFCFLVQACDAQPELPPDLQLLSKIKIQIAQNLIRLPNYTCQQSIERSRRVVPARKFESIDIVRLEVALVEGKELYGWPGADRIEESELSNLVGGTIGNGDFGLLARSIFLSDGSFFTRVGDAALEGHDCIRYDYRVPLLSSGYHLKVPPNEAVVAYHGSFWVEARTLDLIRLDLTADNIPISLGLQASTKTLDYQRTEIGGTAFLLPGKAELTMVDLNGTEHRNRTRFHGCRQYAGESALTFADPLPETVDTSKIQLAEIVLPDEFETEIQLTTPVDSETSAVGDPVEARLVRNLKDRGQTIAPKGATLQGRITRLERRSKSYAFAFRFQSIEFSGARAALSGRDNELTMITRSRTPCLPSAYAACNPAAPQLEPLEVEGHRLRLTRGFPMQLRSRLLKSEKQ